MRQFCMSKTGHRGTPEEQLQAAKCPTVSDCQTRAALLAVIEKREIRTFVQPIVSLKSDRVVGMEALSRGFEASPFESANDLFGASSHSGLTLPLEIACFQQALNYLDLLPGSRWLSINTSEMTLRWLCANGFPESAHKNRLVIELAEPSPADCTIELLATLRRLQSSGIPIVLDDVGCGFASMKAATRLRPDIIKLCTTVIRHVEKDSRSWDDLRITVTELHRSGQMVLAGGIETQAQADLMRELDVDFAQGWLFGRPYPAEHLRY